ncbi:MAG: hypothetical protein COT00_03595 [Candidatus Omnitrophica bacterium CG07_land_8_20_14_0_80_50_8]|nr:MAG: hypothetical protein COT00_03595 [Candidatus Omnitrophica bacterium CG07_land_8_20_14_0_80_50_8]
MEISKGIKPILKAILLCDQTIVEEGTHKRTLIGLFDRIKSNNFPSTHPSMSVYVQFREIEGVFNFTLELVSLTDGKSMNRAVIQAFNVQDKSRDCELVFNLMSVKFEQPGDYEFRIYVNDTVFGQKSFKVLN